MPTIFGKDKDAIVTALRQCSQRAMGCNECRYSGRCYDLHPDAIYLAERLAAALDHVPRSTLLDTLKRCDTCSMEDERRCIFHKLHGSKACDKVQVYMADYIEELFSKFMEKSPPVTTVNKRPFYANVNGRMVDISEILPYDIKPIRVNNMLDASPKVEEDKNMDFASSFWKNYVALKETEERRRMENHFTPKSIEWSADHKTVVVIWNDTEKTIVRLSPNNPDDIYMAFTAALAKRIFGTNSHIKKVIGRNLNEHKIKEKKAELTRKSEEN